MRAKTILGLLFVFSIFAVMATLMFNGGQQKAAGSPAASMVLVAANAAPAGTLLRPQDVKWQAWSNPVTTSEIARPTPVKPDTDDTALAAVYGAVLRQPVGAGEAILSNGIVAPTDRGFLDIALAPGYRAASVSVTATAGAAGRIYPGDRVDVILTQSFNNNEGLAGRKSVSETVVENLRVLAIDQHAKDSNDGTHTVTLEVLPKQAEMVSVANELGKLSLVLRTGNADIGVAADGQRSTWADDVSPALREAKAPAARGGVRVMRGSQTDEARQN